MEISFEELLQLTEALRLKWHAESQEYQALPYGPDRRIAKLKADMTRLDWEHNKNKVKEYIKAKKENYSK